MNRLLFVFLSIGFLAGLNTRANPMELAAQLQTEAYVYVVQADQSLADGRLEEAMENYQAAREAYRRLSIEFPSWEPRIIQYRKTYCDNQIAEIGRRIGERAVARPPLSTPATVVASIPRPAPSAPPSPVVPDRSGEIHYYQSKINELESERLAAEGLQDQLAETVNENRLLQQQLEEARHQLEQRTHVEESTVAVLRAEVAEKDALLQAQQSQLALKQEQDLALNDMEARVNSLRMENTGLRQQLASFQVELDEAVVRAEQAEYLLREAEEQHQQALQNHSSTPAPSAMESPQNASSSPPPPASTAQARPTATAAPAPAASASATPVPVPSGKNVVDFVRQLLHEGRNEEALATVQQAREQIPADLPLTLTEGICLIRLQRYHEASTLLLDLARLNPRNAEVHANLGAAMMGAELYTEARENLQKAIRLDKNIGAEYYFNLAQLYAFIEPVNLRQARKFYKQALDYGLTADPQLEEALNAPTPP
ncbi:MAG: tetratricopeptide repeat protein [Verrucomicrobiota bacterium]|jgi:tetratricopeptide (TPR) repeat protein|nr:tetratricopeptide repeat protein [Verrucomicrobiota bacterium]